MAQPLIIRPSRKDDPSYWSELWAHRTLLYYLIWRDIKIRYKQTVLGPAWAVLQPLLMMLVFTVVFGRMEQMTAANVPYPLFVFAALLPWQLFANALTQCSNSLILNRDLVSKVYFPRIIIPLAAIMALLVEFTIAFVLFLALMVLFQIPIPGNIMALPSLIMLLIFAAVGIGSWLAALNVRYRDIQFTVPFAIQIGLLASPIAYGIQVIPESWRWLYGLNPMIGIIDGFRWALLGQAWSEFTITSLAVLFFFSISGIAYFKLREDTFADLI